MLTRVRANWPEREDGLTAEAVIAALAELHGLGRTIDQPGQHHRACVEVYRAYFQQRWERAATPLAGRMLLAAEVWALEGDLPTPESNAVYEAWLGWHKCYAHGLDLLIEEQRAAIAQSNLAATA